MSARKAKQMGLKPLAKIKAMNVSGIKPQIMGIGPVIAIQKTLKMAKIDTKDIDLIEFNEAFSSQVIATMQEVNIKQAALNINGGSLAIGHPLGATGIRLVGTLAKSFFAWLGRHRILQQNALLHMLMVRCTHALSFALLPI